MTDIASSRNNGIETLNSSGMDSQDNEKDLENKNCDGDCVKRTKIKDYNKWENMYIKYQMQFLKLVDKFSYCHRLYLLMHLETHSFDLVITYETIDPHKRPSIRDLDFIKVLQNNMKDADPVYLELAGTWLSAQPICCPIEFVNFLNTQKREIYPKLTTYQECMKSLQLIKSLTIEFTSDKFLELCPDPMEFIHDVKTYAHFKFNGDKLTYLYDRFPTLPIPLIQAQFHIKHFNLLDTFEELEDIMLNTEKYPNDLRRSFTTGKMIYLAGRDDINLLKEIAFVENKESVEFEMSTIVSMRLSKLEEARILGTLHQCQCCFWDSEMLDSEICCCPKGHTFCFKCIKKYVELEISFKKLEFKCMAECTEYFNLDMLKDVVDDKLCERLIRLQQSEDIKAANIEDLESCKYCDYAASVPQDLKVFKCLNPECGEEICRFCGEKNHLPLLCDEIEKTPEMKVRIMIENKMSEVLIRVCPTCNNNFLKESGCNRMECTCGTRICYICKQIIPPLYEHFFHDNIIPDKCPLFTDENVSHVAAVEAAARLIINDLREKNPELLKKIDIDKLLPKKRPMHLRSGEEISVQIDNEVIAKVLGENVQKIDSLNDMRSFSPEQEKIRPTYQD